MSQIVTDERSSFCQNLSKLLNCNYFKNVIVKLYMKWKWCYWYHIDNHCDISSYIRLIIIGASLFGLIVDKWRLFDFYRCQYALCNEGPIKLDYWISVICESWNMFLRYFHFFSNLCENTMNLRVNAISQYLFNLIDRKHTKIDKPIARRKHG